MALLLVDTELEVFILPWFVTIFSRSIGCVFIPLVWTPVVALYFFYRPSVCGRIWTRMLHQCSNDNNLSPLNDSFNTTEPDWAIDLNLCKCSREQKTSTFVCWIVLSRIIHLTSSWSFFLSLSSICLVIQLRWIACVWRLLLKRFFDYGQLHAFYLKSSFFTLYLESLHKDQLVFLMYLIGHCGPWVDPCAASHYNGFRRYSFAVGSMHEIAYNISTIHCTDSKASFNWYAKDKHATVAIIAYSMLVMRA